MAKARPTKQIFIALITFLAALLLFTGTAEASATYRLRQVTTLAEIQNAGYSVPDTTLEGAKSFVEANSASLGTAGTNGYRIYYAVYPELSAPYAFADYDTLGAFNSYGTNRVSTAESALQSYACYVLELMPTRTTTLDLDSDSVTYRQTNGTTVSADPRSWNIVSAEGWKWYADANSALGYPAKTLELDGAFIDVSQGTFKNTALTLPENATIVLKEGSVNILVSGDVTSGDSVGILAALSLDIRGNGSLYIRAGNASASDANSVGIKFPFEGESNLDVGAGADNPQINITAGPAGPTIDPNDGESYGIFANLTGASCNLESGELTAIGQNGAILAELYTDGVVYAGDASPGSEKPAANSYRISDKWLKASNIYVAPIFNDCLGKTDCAFDTYTVGSVYYSPKDYTFAGWFNGATPLTSADLAQEGVTYTAKWTKNGKTVYTQQLDFIDISADWVNDSAGIAYDFATKTLTLSGATIDCSALTVLNATKNFALGFSDNAYTLVLSDGTVNTVYGPNNASGDSYAVKPSGRLDIKGNGSLACYGGEASHNSTGLGKDFNLVVVGSKDSAPSVACYGGSAANMCMGTNSSVSLVNGSFTADARLANDQTKNNAFWGILATDGDVYAADSAPGTKLDKMMSYNHGIIGSYKYVSTSYTLPTPTRTAPLDLSSNSVTYDDGSTQNAGGNPTISDILDSTEGWKWYLDENTQLGYPAKTLELDGAVINVSEDSNIFALKLPEGSTIVLKEGSHNLITGGGSSYSICGISSVGSLYIIGDGSLDVRISIACGSFTSLPILSYGINIGENNAYDSILYLGKADQSDYPVLSVLSGYADSGNTSSDSCAINLNKGNGNAFLYHNSGSFTAQGDNGSYSRSFYGAMYLENDVHPVMFQGNYAPGTEYSTVYSPFNTISEYFSSAYFAFIDSKLFDIPATTANFTIDTIDVSGNVRGANGNVTFSKESGPEWLNVSAAGEITGTPTSATDETTAVIKVTDSASPPQTRTITINIGAVYVPLSFTDSDAFDIPEKVSGTAIAQFDVSSAASGGKGTFTFTKESGPAWLNISAAGIVTGTPTSDGAATTATIKVADSFSPANTKTITISVGTVYSPLSFTDSDSFDIPARFIGVGMSATDVSTAVTGGKAPYSFTLLNGPGWLNVSADGEITGTPDAEANAATAQIQVTDSFSPANTKTITVNVGAVNPVIYDMNEGEEGAFTKGGTNSLNFRANGEYGKFTTVMVDNAVISSDKYESAEGSTIIRLKASYVNTLAVGEHALRINYTDGYTETTFTVYGDNPATGDSLTELCFIAIVIVSGTAMLIVSRKKRKAL